MKNNFKGETTQLRATIIGITGERNDGAEGKNHDRHGSSIQVLLCGEFILICMVDQATAIFLEILILRQNFTWIF